MNNSKQSTPTKTRPTLYEQIGAEKALHPASRTFVARLKKDERTAKAFAGLKEDVQVAHIAGFMAHVLGGPAHTGPSMYELHRDLSLNDAHYDAYLEILEDSLMDCDMDKQAVQKIISAAREQRNEVLGKGKKPCCLATMAQHCKNACHVDNVYVQAAGATVAVGLLAAASFYAFKLFRKHD